MDMTIHLWIEVSNLQIEHFNILELLIFLVEKTEKKSSDK